MKKANYIPKIHSGFIDPELLVISRFSFDDIERILKKNAYKSSYSIEQLTDYLKDLLDNKINSFRNIEMDSTLTTHIVKYSAQVLFVEPNNEIAIKVLWVVKKGIQNYMDMCIMEYKCSNCTNVYEKSDLTVSDDLVLKCPNCN